MTTVTLRATDASGNFSECTFDVTIVDNTVPTISCPGNTNENADASCDVSLSDYTGAATVADNCDAAPVVTQSPAPGTTISGAGTVTTVTLRATDASGNFSECTFDVTITAPVIDVTGNATSIADGDTTPDASDDTDFGTTATSVMETYTIDNTTGTEALTITSIISSGTNAGEFVVGSIPANVTAGGTETFTVTFTPTNAGIRTATITINNNDCVKFVYDFAIQGTGDAVLSTNDASLLNQLSNIYPNPNKGSFTLNYSGQEQLKELLVIDMLGKRVQTISLESFANSQDINLTALAKGMYFITIQSDTATITKRMIIE